MVNMGELFAHSRLDNATMDRVPLNEQEAVRYLLKSGDLLFARQSLVLEGAGKCAIFVGDKEPVTFESHVTRVRLDQAKADPRFYFYYLQSYEGRSTIRSIVEQGAGASGIRSSDLQRLDVIYPALREQVAIADVLEALDLKIELNQRMNETLEAMARALFRSWFLDFDPVRAKAQARDTGLPAAISTVFSNSFIRSERGEIPFGWRLGKIDDLAEIVGGSTPATSNSAFWTDGQHCWATPKDLASLKAPILLDTERKITDSGLDQISSGLLPPGTVLLSSRAPIGYLALACVPVAINQGFIAMKPRVGTSNVYLLEWTRSSHDEIVSRANGSTFLEINKSNFRPIPVVMPPSAVLTVFDKIARPLFDRIVEADRESRTLAQTRDVLLPRLTSGEIRVRDAEKCESAAA